MTGMLGLFDRNFLGKEIENKKENNMVILELKIQ